MDEYLNGCEECICSRCRDLSCDYCYGNPDNCCCKVECPYDE